MYVGGMLMFFSLSMMATDSIKLSLLLFILFGHFVQSRIDTEEQLLQHKFGHEYLQYKQQVKL
jgi:protein-S-isoprenylcysteine O-methyltransferase Ste14